MGVDEGGIESDKKKVKKSKKGKKDEVNSNGIYEADHGDKNEVIEGGKSAEKEAGKRGDDERRNKKKKKKKKKENKEVSEASNDGYGKRESGNDGEKESEIVEEKNHDGNVIEKVGKKKRKREKNTGTLSDNQLQERNFDDVEGRSMNSEGSNELQNGLAVEAVVPASNGIFVTKDEKKRKKKSKNIEVDSGLGAVPQDKTNLTKHEIHENENQREGVEAFDKGCDLEILENGEKRKKRKREKNKIIVSEDELQGQDFEDAVGRSQLSVDERQKGTDVAAIVQSSDGDVVTKDEKKRKKKKKKTEGKLGPGSVELNKAYLTEEVMCENEDQRGEMVEAFGEGGGLESIKKGGKKKRKRKRKMGEETGISGTTGQGIPAEVCTEGNANSNLELNNILKNGTKGKKEKAKLVNNGSKDPEPKKGKKKVTFSNKEEVFPLSEDNLIRGKRFSKEEDEIVQAAVFKYIEANCLGEEGLNMVLNCRSHPEVLDCWKEIRTALPNRPQVSIYHRAQNLFRRDEKRKWTKEEIEMLRESHEKNGNQWKALADQLGKHRIHVRDTWRRIRHANLKKGQWSQEEYQNLFDLVNTDLRLKYSEEKKSKYGMLRDNIPWTAISDKLSTRSDAKCCTKWYNQLTSPMVADGEWADTDDYRLIDALFELDASCYEDVDWDNLLDQRSGAVCRKRWKEMFRHMGDNSNKSFAGQVEVLAKRYCPELLEARESWDSKPYVP